MPSRCGWCVPVSDWFLGLITAMPLPPIYRDIRRLLVHTEGVVPFAFIFAESCIPDICFA